MQQEETGKPSGQQPSASPGVQPPSWQFSSNNAAAAAPNESPTEPAAAPAASSSQPVSWTASEFVHNHKTSGWFMMLGLGAAVLAIAVYFITKDFVSPVVIIIAAAIFGVAAARTPRTLTYQIDASGIRIGTKLYPHSQFKSFALIDEQGIGSIWLMPLKRFMPGLTIYYDPAQEDPIVNTLANYLPLEERQPDSVDRLMQRLRF